MNVHNTAVFAASWWATQFGPLSKKDAADPDSVSKGIITALNMLDLLTAPLPDTATKAKIENFKVMLTAKIENQLGQGKVVELDVDYHPEGVLGECADLAGLGNSLTDWPWKTFMRVQDNLIQVRHAGQEWKVVYPETTREQSITEEYFPKVDDDDLITSSCPSLATNSTVLQLSDSAPEVIQKLAENNLDALEAIREVVVEAVVIDPYCNFQGSFPMMTLLQFDSHGHRGERLGKLWDLVNKNVKHLMAVERGIQLGLIYQRDVDLAISNQVPLDWENILTMVQERLPNFGSFVPEQKQ
jgi:hypothetical protein